VLGIMAAIATPSAPPPSTTTTGSRAFQWSVRRRAQTKTPAAR
jgi:hypothetical protein